MSSRQAEKERRRQERLVAEAQAARREVARRPLQWVGGALLAVVALAVVVVAVIPNIGGDGGGTGGGGAMAPRTGLPPLPPPQSTDLGSSVKAAGCVARTLPSEGQTHSPNPSDWKYNTNPPTSGTHSPTAASDGVYSPLQAPSAGETVHALEHGRVDIQYRPGLARRDIAQLEALVAENDGYHQLLFQNQTKMPFAIAATAWTQMLGCKTFSPKVFDALRNFRERYADQAPEQVP